jgi:hypothetical protein
MFVTRRQRELRKKRLAAAAIACASILVFLPRDLSGVSQVLGTLSPVATVEAAEPANLD